MGFSTAGIDRFLTAATGGSASAATAMQLRLHTGATPAAGNQLSGNGYAAVTVTATGFAISTQSGYRRLALPAAEWFSDATASAQTAESIGFWHGSALIYHWPLTVTPNDRRVFSNAGDLYIEVDLSETSWVWTTAGIDRGLQAIQGSAVRALTTYWELHSGTPPTSGNRLTGGGIDGVDDVAWSFASVSGVRRRRQAALSWSGGLTGNASAAIQSIGYWSGRPESSGTLLAYRPTSAVMPVTGDAVTMAANSLFTGVNIAGVAV